MPQHQPSRKQFMAAGAAAGAAVLGFNRLANAEDHPDMITQLATLGVDPDKFDELKPKLEELVAAVEANEPGVLAYICHRSEKEPDKIVFFEIYKDQETLAAHGQTPHLAKMREYFAAGLMKPPIDIHKLNRVAGFSRS